MSRPSTRAFLCAPLAELSRQLLFSPAAKRVEQVERAEQLHDQLDEQGNYPLDFIVFRITGRRVVSRDVPVLVGQAVLSDLRLLIDMLSRSVDVPVRDEDPIETTQQLASRLGVAVRTIDRWRTLGLRWRWKKLPGRRTCSVVFPRSALQTFAQRNPGRIEEASRFTRVPAAEQRQLLSRARRLAQSVNVSLNQVALHLSRKSSRPLSTVRYLLQQHDRRHPHKPIFADRTGPLTVAQQESILQDYRTGTPIGLLTIRYKRTRTTIYRAIAQRRAAVLRRLNLHFVDTPSFHRPDAQQVILRPEASIADTRRADPGSPPTDLPAELASLFTSQPATETMQRHWFAQVNFLRFRIISQRQSIDTHEPRSEMLSEMEDMVTQVAQIRRRLLLGNLPVVLSVARLHIHANDPPAKVLRLIEDGFAVLIDAMESYDFTREQTFESFLTWRLMRRFAAQMSPAASDRSESQIVASSATARPRALRRHEPAESLRHLQELARESGIELLESAAGTSPQSRPRRRSRPTK